ncbi:MAG: NAD-dependent epimerase/dehydratase family protein [Candidatus Melainabacteria bacterium]|nr:NAD-dependent epimerase/dehydratase family protein [Candidatus Melainabacteria bacterium]
MNSYSDVHTHACVLVDGASGYLGNHVVAALLNRGLVVHALVRPQVADSDREFLQESGAQVFAVDLAPFQSEMAPGQRRKLEEAFSGVSHAVHLIGSIAPAKAENFMQLHQEQSRAFASWCVRARDVAGFVRAAMVTALGADQNAASDYLRSKREGELALLSELEPAKIASSIFRPSLIVGRAVGRRDSKIVKRYRQLARTRPFVPLVNGGRNLVQPVFVTDLAEAIVERLCHQSIADFTSETFEIGGAQPVAMREVVEGLMAAIKVRKSFVEIPLPLALMAANLMQRIQDVPLLSADQVRMTSFDNICTDNALSKIINHSPTSLADALATYQNWDGD